MDHSARRPLQISRPERRTMLSRHFTGVIEGLVSDGEPYAELSVQRIIKAGGISRSTFYAYFDDKGDLLRAMAQEVISDLVGVGRLWWELSPNATKADLRAALRVPIDSYRAHRTIFGAVVETAAYDPRVREQQQSLIDQVVAALTAHVEDARKAGRADPELDAHRTAKWIVWMLERGLYQLVGSADETEAGHLIDALTGMIWRILYADRERTGSP